MTYKSKGGKGKIIFWIIAGLAAAFAAYKLYGAKIKALFAKKK